MKTLIHFGCSFAVGNGVPKYLEGLESGASVNLRENRGDFKKKYGMNAEEITTCGSKGPPASPWPVFGSAPQSTAARTSPSSSAAPTSAWSG